MLPNLNNYSYSCAPEKCGDQVCCAHFAVAVTAAEQARIISLINDLRTYCADLTPENIFQVTPVFCFLSKRENGLCCLNYRAENGGYYCALHSLAIAQEKNPYQSKPRGCRLFPLIEDGAGNLSIYDGDNFPCLQKSPIAQELPDENLLALWREIQIM